MNDVLIGPRMASQLGLTQMITIEIKVPNRMVGLGVFLWVWLYTTVISRVIPISSVIGRQGEMINRLQADSSARIQVAPGE